MILRFILWWISRPRSLYETEMVYWKVRRRILERFPFMREELDGNQPFFEPHENAKVIRIAPVP